MRAHQRTSTRTVSSLRRQPPPCTWCGLLLRRWRLFSFAHRGRVAVFNPKSCRGSCLILHREKRHFLGEAPHLDGAGVVSVHVAALVGHAHEHVALVEGACTVAAIYIFAGGRVAERADPVRHAIGVRVAIARSSVRA